MKIRLLLSTLICAVALAPAIRAEDAKPAGAPEKEQTELGKNMEKMSGAFRKLKTRVEDPTKNAESLAAVADLRSAAEAALKFEPAMKSMVPAADQAKFVADYKAKLQATVDEIVKLQDALKAGDNAAAKASYDKVAALQREGHTEFRPKKK